MSIQSPKSQRPSAPGESPASDNLSETHKDHVHPGENTPSGSGTPSVPGGLDRGPHGGTGQVESEAHVPVHEPAPHQGGGPGFAPDKGDGSRTGGTVHQT